MNMLPYFWSGSETYFSGNWTNYFNLNIYIQNMKINWKGIIVMKYISKGYWLKTLFDFDIPENQYQLPFCHHKSRARLCYIDKKVKNRSILWFD